MTHTRTLILCLCTGLFLFAGVGVGWYVLGVVDRMSTTLHEKYALLQGEEDRQRMVLDVRRQMGRLKEERTELGRYFVKEENVLSFVEQLENLAKHTGVDLDITTATAVGEGKDTFFRLGLKTKGSWQDSQYFLSLVESLPIRLLVNRVLFLGGDGGKIWDGEMTITILSFIPQETAKK